MFGMSVFASCIVVIGATCLGVGLPDLVQGAVKFKALTMPCRAAQGAI